MTMLHAKEVSLNAKSRNGKDHVLRISNEVKGKLHLVYYTFENGQHCRHELYVQKKDLAGALIALANIRPAEGKHAKKDDSDE